MDAIENNEDDLLLLTMRLDTDEDDFEKAKKNLKLLQDGMKDTSMSFDLSNIVNALIAAANILRTAVSAWNSLENKTLSVATNRNYLPYGISSGEAESISTKIDANKVAQKEGFTGAGTLLALSNIAEEQARVVWQGEKPNQANWISLYELGQTLGDSRFQGTNLSDLLTRDTSAEVLSAISDLIVNATRKAYSLPEGSKERQSLLQRIKQVESSPYVPSGMFEYVSVMTKPENQTWGKTGNPVVPLISATPEDIGAYGKNLEKESAKATSIHEALAYLKTEREETLNRLATSAYNVIGESTVLPLSREVVKIGKVFSGKAMKDYMPFEGIDVTGVEGVTNAGTFIYNTTEAKRHDVRRKLSAPVLLSETGDVFKGDLAARAAQALHYSKDTDFDVLGEIGLYEAAKIAQTDFAQQSLQAMVFARDLLTKNVTGKYKYTEGRKKGKTYSATDARIAAEELLTDEDSVYAQAYQEGGFTGLYGALYKEGALPEKEYLGIMERVVNETKTKEIEKFYPDIKGAPEVTAKQKEVNGRQVLRLEIHKIDDATGEETVVTQDISPEELSSLRINMGGI